MNSNFNHNQQNEPKITPSENSSKKPTFKKIDKNTFQTLMVIFMPIAIYVIILVILNANLLFPWQATARHNKKAILEYAEEYYPDAKILEQHYPSTIPRFTTAPFDYIIFELDGVKFSLQAQFGNYVDDYYWDGVADKAIDEKFLKPFFEPQSIKADFEIYAPDLREFFRENPDSEITQFDETGTRTYIVIRPKKINGKETPQDLGWMYDFYCYWQENTTLPSYTVTLIYPPVLKGDYFIHFTEYSNFQSEEEFYAAFVHDV